MGQVGRLMPGITSVTPHARYYVLHALVAAEAERRNLIPEEARQLLRRCEVVIAGVTHAHGDHPGMPNPHGGAQVRASMATGVLDVAGLIAERRYSQAPWGFWGPYLGSEALLGLVTDSKGLPAPGEALNKAAVTSALADLLPLAAMDSIDVATLAANSHLCLCQVGSASDGAVLTEALLPSEVRERYPEDWRRQSLRMLLRLTDMAPSVESAQRDLSRFLVFDPAARDDAVLNGLDVTQAWVGVVLRSLSVAAWRDMWSWLVAEIDGFMPIPDLGAKFADHLPAQTVREFRTGLPAGFGPGGVLLPAEYDPSVAEAETPVRTLATVLVGGDRFGRLPERPAAYFEGARSEHAQQLTPSWIQARADEWADRSVRDFAVWLTGELVARSQRLALTKAAFDKKTGRFTVPTRVFVREGHVFRDSNEGGGGISLRFDTATTVMAGLGLVERVDNRWVVTDKGRAA